MIPGLTAGEARDLILSVGTHQGKRRLRPRQVAALLAKALDSGASRASLAESLGLRDSSMIGRFLKLNQIPEGASDLVGWGRTPGELSLSVACEVAVAQPEDRDLLAAAAQAHRLTKEETRAVVQTRARSGRSLEDSIRAIVELRPEIVRRYVVLGAIESQSLRRALARFGHADRQDLFADVLVGLDLQASGSLRPTGFSVSRLDEPLPPAEGLEAAIAEGLAKRIGT